MPDPLEGVAPDGTIRTGVTAAPSRRDVKLALGHGGVVPVDVDSFADLIGLWPTEDGAGGVRRLIAAR
ncbi:hypothetical protein BW730_05395 [Tessaracoccus aquimaris]|uniref:Uncharacterized protein n=1 Tax=Tessaracoccus aquimaris TaxID=1332264 RepID=A0A1Q2CLP3_9ACTN|nr:hypothetical protein [Tessaracoccus aquimaris]AQP47034.1 hypothetical protein BW730_05395 [Tessaracoccus aquimaris]